MNQALALNAFIILAVLVAMVVLKNPLALFGLLLLKELPYGLMVPQESADEVEDAEGIGFVR